MKKIFFDKLKCWLGKNWLFSLTFLLGGFLRFYSLNWDKSHFFHPDERNIALAVSRIHFFNQLNPKFFAYGNLPLYLYRAAGDTLAFFTQNSSWVYDWGKINLIGRSISAFLSTLIILLVFLTAQKIWNKKIALASSFFTAFCPSLIQTAHFSTTENMLVFWLFIICLFSLEIIKKPTLKNYLKPGVILGLACATKISALSFLIMPTTAHFSSRFKYLKQHLFFMLSLLTALLVFSAFSPYVFLDSQKFLESMRYESEVATGKLRVVYTLQFEKTLPYLFQIKNLFWQMGPVASLGILGMLFLLISTIKNKDKKVLVFLSFPIVYFIYVSSWHAKFIRYMVPVIPFLTISAAWLLFKVKKRWQTPGKVLILTFSFATLFWALAFFSIYNREQTRIAASQFIYQNIPAGSKILTEHWDDGLPIPLLPETPGKYQIEQLTIYEPDNQEKIEYYAEKLSKADYIIINSRRLYGTLIYLPEKYPITSRYYTLLFSGGLGYEKIAEFSSYPKIFGLQVNDDSSEETFQVYDHPKVLIFKNKSQFTKKQYLEVFQHD